MDNVPVGALCSTQPGGRGGSPSAGLGLWVDLSIMADLTEKACPQENPSLVTPSLVTPSLVTLVLDFRRGRVRRCGASLDGRATRLAIAWSLTLDFKSQGFLELNPRPWISSLFSNSSTIHRKHVPKI